MLNPSHLPRGHGYLITPPRTVPPVRWTIFDSPFDNLKRWKWVHRCAPNRDQGKKGLRGHLQANAHLAPADVLAAAILWSIHTRPVRTVRPKRIRSHGAGDLANRTRPREYGNSRPSPSARLLQRSRQPFARFAINETASSPDHVLRESV